jgi:hypothetical protein
MPKTNAKRRLTLKEDQMEKADTVVAVFADHNAAVESAIMVGGLSGLGAALYSIGVPKDSVIQYETALKAGSLLVMAHGTAADMARAKAILGTASPSRLDVHAAWNRQNRRAISSMRMLESVSPR